MTANDSAITPVDIFQREETTDVEVRSPLPHQSPDPQQRRCRPPAAPADDKHHDSDLLTVKEAADLLRCSKSYLDKLRCAGGGPEFVRLGVRKILYRRLDLLTWAKSRRFNSTSQYGQ